MIPFRAIKCNCELLLIIRSNYYFPGRTRVLKKGDYSKNDQREKSRRVKFLTLIGCVTPQSGTHIELCKDSLILKETGSIFCTEDFDVGGRIEAVVGLYGLTRVNK